MEPCGFCDANGHMHVNGKTFVCFICDGTRVLAPLPSPSPEYTALMNAIETHQRERREYSEQKEVD